MKILIVGGGPGGLYAGLLLKKVDPSFDIEIIERNPADATYGWGVVFSDRTMRSFREADLETYQAITDDFVLWQAIDIHYRDQLLRCGGHSFAGMSRRRLLQILQERCRELGVRLTFDTEFSDLSVLPEFDLVIAADGINSIIRGAFAADFKPEIVPGRAKFIWLGTDRLLDAFTFVFVENEHGLFQAHAYPFDGRTSTFIVECEETVWRSAGLDAADEAQSVAYCEALFSDFLGGRQLFVNKSDWLNFNTISTRKWRHQNTVLLGDSAHTAHFSIGSGTKLAMDGAIALADGFRQTTDLDRALNAYEMERRPRVVALQEAASQSQRYFESITRYLSLEPDQFAFHLLTRSGRITYDNLRLRDAGYVDGIDGWFGAAQAGAAMASRIAPPPMFAPLQLRAMTLPNRAVLSPRSGYDAHQGVPSEPYKTRLMADAGAGASLLLTEPVAISAQGRITSGCTGMYDEQHLEGWRKLVAQVHQESSAKIGLRLNHAGRRASTRPRQFGMDRSKLEDGWPLISSSPIPFGPGRPAPKQMSRSDMDGVREGFIRSAKMAMLAGFDLVQLHMAHGYLLAGFLSPAVNQRTDDYGGSLENRLRFPLEVASAVRAVWPDDKPLSASISAVDWLKGGLSREDSVIIARALHAVGIDIFEILAGQTSARSRPIYGPGFLTDFSDFIRYEAKVPTMVGGYLTTSGQVNSILAAGRADLCILEE